MAEAKKRTARQIDALIKQADDKIDKYKGYIARLQAEKKELNAEKRKLTTAAAKKTTTAKATSKTTAKKPAAKKTTASKTTTTKSTASKTTAKKPATKKTTATKTTTKTTRKPAAKKEKSLLDGLLEGVKQSTGMDAGDILESILGKK